MSPDEVHQMGLNEVERLLAFVKSQRAKPQAKGKTDEDEQTAWTAAARVLLNLDEFVTRE